MVLLISLLPLRTHRRSLTRTGTNSTMLSPIASLPFLRIPDTSPSRLGCTRSQPRNSCKGIICWSPVFFFTSRHHSPPNAAPNWVGKRTATVSSRLYSLRVSTQHTLASLLASLCCRRCNGSSTLAPWLQSKSPERDLNPRLSCLH